MHKLHCTLQSCIHFPTCPSASTPINALPMLIPPKIHSKNAAHWKLLFGTAPLPSYICFQLPTYHEKKYALSFKCLTSKSPFAGMAGNVSGLQTGVYLLDAFAEGRFPVNFSSKCETVV
jgi:hypothetical protein